MMLRTAIFGLALLLTSQTAISASFDDGVAAMQSGDYSQALDLWSKSAGEGDARAQYSLGYLYQFGLGVPVSWDKAKEWYEKAAAQNNGDALYALVHRLIQKIPAAA